MLLSGAALAVASSLYLGVKAFGWLPSQRKSKAPPVGEETHQSLEVVEEKSGQNLEVVTTAEERKVIDHFFKVSSAVVGVSAVTMLVFPPAHIIAIPPLLYTLIPVFVDAYQGLKQRKLRPSLVESIAVGGAIFLGMLNNLNPYFFMAGAMGVWLYFLSAKLVLKTKDASKKDLTNLFGEQVRSVWLLRDGAEVEIPFEDVQVGDIVAVNAGEVIPVDGSIVEGIGSIDQRMLTGESQPVEKGVGESVFAATTLLSGRLQISVEKAGVDALASQISEIWSRTADYRTSIETRGEQLSHKSVLPTLGTGTLALATLGPVGATAILLSNFSDAIQLAAPLSTLNFLHLASKNSILIKDGRALEGLNEVDTVVFDKTGTLTLEQPHVGGIYLYDSHDENSLLTYAAAIEVRQSHPIARAILQESRQRQLELPPLNDASYEVGYGIKAQINNHLVRVGSDRFMIAEGVALPDTLQQQLTESRSQGYSLVMVALDDCLSGAIELHPTIRPEAKAIISGLKERNLSLCIISGDHHIPTQALADELGIDQFFAEVLPEDKASMIKRLQQQGKKVCFVGDGINDAIALKQANVSVSLSGAASAATDTAQIIMMDGSLQHFDSVFTLSQRYDNNLQAGFKTVLGGSVICVGGVFFLHFGIFSALTLQALTIVASVGNAFLPTLSKENKQLLLSNGPDDKVSKKAEKSSQ